MSTRPRTLARSLIAGLTIVGLLAACGGDDDTADDTTTTTEVDAAPAGGTDGGEATAEEAAIDICGLLDIELVNRLTGEDFSVSDRYEDESCRLTGEEGDGFVQLSLHLLDEGETEAGFITEGQAACDAGTLRDDIDFSFASGGGFACDVDGEASMAAGHEGAIALLVGHPSSEVPEGQPWKAMAEILADIVSG